MEGREDARGKVGSVLETLEVMPRVELLSWMQSGVFRRVVV